MKSIVVIAHRRPEYLRKCLHAIRTCRAIEGWFVAINVDGPETDPQVIQCQEVAFEFQSVYGACCYISEVNDGVNKNNFIGIHREFIGAVDAVLVVEEDVILAPDALQLCDWFLTHPERDNYACLLLHAFSEQPQDPVAMQECMRFCPWGWLVTHEMWERWFKPNWNCKKVPPFGWDWALGYIIQKHGLKSLRPRMSRVRNIGREGGVYETPEHYDSFHGRNLVHDGSPAAYEIVDRLGPDYAAVEMEQWVKEELAHG